MLPRVTRPYIISFIPAEICKCSKASTCKEGYIEQRAKYHTRVTWEERDVTIRAFDTSCHVDLFTNDCDSMYMYNLLAYFVFIIRVAAVR